LLPTEDANLYYAMLASIAQSIRPGDCITWLLIKDLADHRVEVARYRRFKTGLLQAAANKRRRTAISGWRGIADRVAPDLEKRAKEEKQIVARSNKTPAEIEQLNRDIDNKARAEIAKQEAEAQSAIRAWGNPSTEADFVELFHDWFPQQEQIESLLCAAEGRFTSALEELNRHVRGLGQTIREKWDIIEGELLESPALAQPSTVQRSPLESPKVSNHHEAASRTIPRGKRIAQQGRS